MNFEKGYFRRIDKMIKEILQFPRQKLKNMISRLVDVIWIKKWIVVNVVNLVFYTLALSKNDNSKFDLSPLRESNRIEIKLSTGFASGTVRGQISSITGNLNFSAQRPREMTGQIFMDARTLRFGFNKVDGEVHNPEWLGSSKFPNLSFPLNSLENPEWHGEILGAVVKGNLLIKNRSIPLSAPVFFKYLRKERKKYDGKFGDIIFIKGEFPLSRGKIGINPGVSLNSVMDEITVNIHLMAASSHIRPFLPIRVFGGQP